MYKICTVPCSIRQGSMYCRQASMFSQASLLCTEVPWMGQGVRLISLSYINLSKLDTGDTMTNDCERARMSLGVRSSADVRKSIYHRSLGQRRAASPGNNQSLTRMLVNGPVTRGCASKGPSEGSSRNLGVCSSNKGHQQAVLVRSSTPVCSLQHVRSYCWPWSSATALSKRRRGPGNGEEVPQTRVQRLRLRASTLEADTGALTQIPTLDRDLHRKCLKAAVHLQEHGWAVVEGVLSE